MLDCNCHDDEFIILNDGNDLIRKSDESFCIKPFYSAKKSGKSNSSFLSKMSFSISSIFILLL